jgi:hypothetical protein
VAFTVVVCNCLIIAHTEDGKWKREAGNADGISLGTPRHKREDNIKMDL